jgi:hypothetical protein
MKTVIVGRIVEVIGVSHGLHGAEKLIDNPGRGTRRRFSNVLVALAIHAVG